MLRAKRKELLAEKNKVETAISKRNVEIENLNGDIIRNVEAAKTKEDRQRTLTSQLEEKQNAIESTKEETKEKKEQAEEVQKQIIGKDNEFKQVESAFKDLKEKVYTMKK